MKKLVLVANQSEVRIFRYIVRQRKLKLITTLKNELGRERNKNLTRDKPGTSIRTTGRNSVVRGTKNTTNPHKNAARKFARSVAKTLEKAYQGNQFDQLVIAAEPNFCGVLKSQLSARMCEIVQEWKQKNYIKMSDHDVNRIFSISQ